MIRFGRPSAGRAVNVHFWYGNSAALACIKSEMKRSAMFVHGAALTAEAVIRPDARMLRSEPRQLRLCLAKLLHGTGNVLGSASVRVDHR